jgi:L-malate glycosyltransferase
MNNKPHILVIPSWYPEYPGHYVGSFFREQAIGLHKSNAKVGLIFPDLKSLRSLKKIRLLPAYRNYIDDGVITYKILWSNWFIKMKFLQIFIFTKLGMYLFDKYVSENGMPDLIHSQSIFNSGFLAKKIHKKYKIPYVLTEHNSGFYYHNQGFKKYYNSVRSIINSSAKCFAVSRSYAKYLDKELKCIKKWDVHHNLVADSFLKTDLLALDNQIFKFICISRLDKIKNIDLIIKSFKKFNSKVQNSELKIIGVGGELNYLKNLRNDLDLKNQVKFLGKIDRQDLTSIINNSHAFLYGSNFETFGVIFIESMALGKPIISTNCKSIEEIINDDIGIISPNNINDFYKSMLYVFNNYKKYNHQNIRNFCKKNFSESKLSNDLIKHFNLIIKNDQK